MSAPTDVCQCGHTFDRHTLVPLSGYRRSDCRSCPCARFAARGLPPESQGEAWYKMMADREAQHGSECGAGNPAPQPAEPCAQGASATSFADEVARAVYARHGSGFEHARAHALKALNAAAAAKDARIAELEAEKAAGFRNIIHTESYRIEQLTAQLSEVTRERDAWKIKRDLVFTGYKRVLTRAAELERERNGMRDDRNIAIRAAREAQTRLAASETDRERLRELLTDFLENYEFGPAVDARIRAALAPALATEGEA